VLAAAVQLGGISVRLCATVDPATGATDGPYVIVNGEEWTLEPLGPWWRRWLRSRMGGGCNAQHNRGSTRMTGPFHMKAQVAAQGLDSPRRGLGFWTLAHAGHPNRLCSGARWSRRHVGTSSGAFSDLNAVFRRMNAVTDAVAPQALTPFLQDDSAVVQP
jgi:hypothetical protein